MRKEHTRCNWDRIRYSLDEVEEQYVGVRRQQGIHHPRSLQYHHIWEVEIKIMAKKELNLEEQKIRNERDVASDSVFITPFPCILRNISRNIICFPRNVPQPVDQIVSWFYGLIILVRNK